MKLKELHKIVQKAIDDNKVELVKNVIVAIVATLFTWLLIIMIE